MKSMNLGKRHQTGFTIVELLIVIVVIGILAAITVVAYNGIQARANDAKRAQDIKTIQTALQAYDVQNSGLPRTHTPGSYTNGVIYAGWDASVSPNWLAFLKPMIGTVPVDPVNTIAAGNNPPAGGNMNYFYYCYTAGSGPLPSTANVMIGYHKSDGSSATRAFAVNACT